MTASANNTTATLPFSTLDDEGLAGVLKEHRIGLTAAEARKITSLLGRDPTLTEAVIWGIQGSEHCSYKSSRRFLRTLPTEGEHVILGPIEDSGIVAITDEPKGKRWGLVIAHESHNHPSQIVPFEGAATGVGGVVRDVVCMGARVIGCMDLLRLGDLKTPESRTIAREVVRGIAGYGNPLGIPNLGGDTTFDASYNGNCLVNAVAVGLVREDEVIRSRVPAEAGKKGYDMILVGKPTDRSGFGGASFASVAMEEDKREQNAGAVQEPNPFLERHLLASCYALFDWLAAEGRLGQVSCKDLGAGGVVCATVEQVADAGLGAEVDLDRVHVALADLPPEVIGCAETQERLCFTCHPDLTERILRHFNETWNLPSVAEGARASVIGKVIVEPVYRARHRGQVVCEAKALDITCGLQEKRPLSPKVFAGSEPDITCDGDHMTVGTHRWTIGDVFQAMLTHRNGCSRGPVFRGYDKNVIGNTVLEPGEADAGVIMPLQDLQSYVHEGTHPDWDALPPDDRFRGVALAGAGNGRYGRISPYWQGVTAVVEAVRGITAVGAAPRALTDCLNYGNPEVPGQMWELSEGVRGIADAARGIGPEGQPVPIISGNVSLYNGQSDGSAIDPTAVVTCVGILPDARRPVGIRIQEVGLQLFMVGARRDECGGSLYYDVLEGLAAAPRNAFLGQHVPQPDLAEVSREIGFTARAINEGLVAACHDISEGGVLLALFEMLATQRKQAFGGGLRITLDDCGDLPSDRLLFSESGGFILAATEKNAGPLTNLATALKISLVPVAVSTDKPALRCERHGKVLLNLAVSPLRLSWAAALEESWSD